MRRGILASRDELKALRKKITRSPFNTIFDRLRKRCDLILEAAPVSEAQWRSMWERGEAGAAVQAARTSQGRIMDLLIAYHIDANRAFMDRAAEELRNLVSWSTWTDPAHAKLPADLCTAEAAVAATVGLDWLWEDISEEDRQRTIRAIQLKAVEPYRKAVAEKAWWVNCYHSWNVVVNGGCGLAALALGDEEPAADGAYERAISNMRPFLEALGHDGGWDEGTGYWGYAIRYALLFAQAASRLKDDQRVFHSRGMDSTGLFPIYFTPNGQPASFGEGAAAPLYGTMYLLAAKYGLKEVAWWLDAYGFHSDVSMGGWSEAGLAMLFRPEDEGARGEPSLAPLKVFHEIGWAAMADNWPRPSFYVAAKTGDLAANHSQRDMNSIQVQVDGEMLLTDIGDPQHGAEYAAQAAADIYEVEARAHNTVIVADRDHLPDAQGEIVESGSGQNFRWALCDAGEACGETVRFMRHVVMVVDPKSHAGKMLVVLDELFSEATEKFEMFWHTRGRIELDAAALAGRIVGEQSELRVAFAAMSPFEAVTGSHKAAHGGADRFIQIRGRITGRTMLLSVFSRGPLAGRPAIEEASGGQVDLRIGDVAIHFKSGKQHLKLAGVTMGR